MGVKGDASNYLARSSMRPVALSDTTGRSADAEADDVRYLPGNANVLGDEQRVRFPMAGVNAITESRIDLGLEAISTKIRRIELEAAQRRKLRPKKGATRPVSGPNNAPSLSFPLGC